MKLAKAGELAMLATLQGKQFIFKLEADASFQSHRGVIQHNDLIGHPWGTDVQSHLGHEFHFFRPTLRDILLLINRRSQIIFPKDIGYILLRLSVGPGARVLEAGTGSGALTTALAWAVGPTGQVVSYDRRADMQDLARRNLAQADLLDRVTLAQGEVEDGFDAKDMDAVFYDLPAPHLYLDQARACMVNGGVLGAILPTANQVSALLAELHAQKFTNIDVCEILLRFYKDVPERLRPADRMVAHTGYLVFARPVVRR
jgi:tRNA (adenine57-N1/adenine58-N1)-methyltransferase catalytic subunit